VRRAPFRRVPLFFYIAHIYLLHATAILFAWIKIGGTVSTAATHKPDGYGLGLAGIYTVWLAAVILLWPLCAWFAAIKRRARRMVVELPLSVADLHERIEMPFKRSGFIVVMECPLGCGAGEARSPRGVAKMTC
jgi:hypothetical protein